MRHPLLSLPWLLVALTYPQAASLADGPVSLPPSATPGSEPTQQMQQEIAALRTALALARFNRAVPLAEPDILARRKAYEKLIARHHTEAEPHVAYGEFLLFLQENETAFQQWALAIGLDPTRHDILAAQADILLQTGQIVAAADALERAATLAPTNADYQFSLAHIYTLFRRDLIASRNASEGALITRGTAYFRRAAELAPDNLAYVQAYAEAFYTQPDADWAVARAAWESLLPRSPDKNFIHSHLVRINIRLRDKAAAARHLAALTDPAFATLREKLRLQVEKLQGTAH